LASTFGTLLSSQGTDAHPQPRHFRSGLIGGNSPSLRPGALLVKFWTNRTIILPMFPRAYSETMLVTTDDVFESFPADLPKGPLRRLALVATDDASASFPRASGSFPPDHASPVTVLSANRENDPFRRPGPREEDRRCTRPTVAR
jgi:hypothetical protein